MQNTRKRKLLDTNDEMVCLSDYFDTRRQFALFLWFKKLQTFAADNSKRRRRFYRLFWTIHSIDASNKFNARCKQEGKTRDSLTFIRQKVNEFGYCASSCLLHHSVESCHFENHPNFFQTADIHIWWKFYCQKWPLFGGSQLIISSKFRSSNIRGCSWKPALNAFIVWRSPFEVIFVIKFDIINCGCDGKWSKQWGKWSQEVCKWGNGDIAPLR